jgi:hypothetical protein
MFVEKKKTLSEVVFNFLLLLMGNDQLIEFHLTFSVDQNFLLI